jgi:ribulose-phosphate 3-epimerase
MKLYPGILTDSFLELQKNADAVKDSPLIEALHIDIIDGQFVDNLTVTPLDLTVGDFEPLKIDFHLMAEEPMDFVFECEGVKDYLPIRRLIAQVERMTSQADFLYEVKKNEWEAALALNLFTPLEAIDEEVWAELDHILLMGTEAGASGQTFHPQVLEKVRDIRKLFPDAERMHILIDGGVKTTNLKQILADGADEITATSIFWQSEEPLLMVEEFFRVAGEK